MMLENLVPTWIKKLPDRSGLQQPSHESHHWALRMTMVSGQGSNWGSQWNRSWVQWFRWKHMSLATSVVPPAWFFIFSSIKVGLTSGILSKGRDSRVQVSEQLCPITSLHLPKYLSNNFTVMFVNTYNAQCEEFSITHRSTTLKYLWRFNRENYKE